MVDKKISKTKLIIWFNYFYNCGLNEVQRDRIQTDMLEALIDLGVDK